MKIAHPSFSNSFRVLCGNSTSQAATLVLQSGEREGGCGNRHSGACQWLFVVSGTGEAEISGKKFELTPHTLLLVEKGEEHGFVNTGSEALKFLTFYVPPAYDNAGEELPAGKP